MRCCASPTISTAGEAAERGRDARDAVAAILFREVLKPLAKGLGPVGEIALGAVADELFVRRPR
jgi:hypothetical protein